MEKSQQAADPQRAEAAIQPANNRGVPVPAVPEAKMGLFASAISKLFLTEKEQTQLKLPS